MDDGDAPRRRGLLGIPGTAFVGSVLAIAIVVNAAVVATQQATMTPRTVSPLPVTLSAVPLSGTTVTGGTSASSSGIIPIAAAANALTIARQAPNDWDVKLAVTAATGIGGSGLTLEGFTLAITGGPSLVLTPSTVYPQVSTAATLNAGGLTTTTASTAVNGCHSCTITAELRITPSSGSLPSFVYPWTITTAA